MPESLISLYSSNSSLPLGKESTSFLLQVTFSVLYFERKHKFQILDMFTYKKEKEVPCGTQTFLTTVSGCTDIKAMVLAGLS